MHDRRALLKGIGGLAAAAVLPAASRAAEAVGRSGRVGGKAVRVVDIHAHCVVDVSDILKGTKFEGRGRTRAGMAIDAARAARMAAKRIDVQLLSINPYWYEMDRDLAVRFIDRQNAKLAEATQSSGGRYYALATVAMQDPELAASQLEDGVKRLGMRGAAIGCTVGGDELSDPRFDVFWKKAQDLNAPVFLHPVDSQRVTGVAKRTEGAGSLDNVIGNPLETTIALSHMIFQGTFDRFPQLKISAAHGGGYLGSYVDRSDHGCIANPDTCKPTDPVLKLKPSEYLKRIYVDALVFTPEATRHLAAVCGPRQLMIGTDDPYPWFDDPVGTVMATPGLTNGDRIAILGGTACRLLDIPV